MWTCQCDCGKTVNVASKDLKNGSSKSCGCSRKLNLIGKKFGKLTVISEYHGKEKKSYEEHSVWNCLCECGKEHLVVGYYLTAGRVNSCGCGGNQKIDLTGQKFGKLLVIEEMPERKKKHIVWLCRCECGTVVEVRTGTLRKGEATHCGCSLPIKEAKDLTNKTYGRLTALKIVERTPVKWECQCICGNKKIVGSAELVSGNTQSCGCYFLEKISGKNHWKYNPDREGLRLKQKLRAICGRMLRRCLKISKKTKTSTTFDMIGYTNIELREHLQITFDKDLQGKHVDHIFPINAFYSMGITDPKIINALDNIQLLDAFENISKSDKYDQEEFEAYLTTRNIGFTRPEKLC
jgi:hypothetical protein